MTDEPAPTELAVAGRGAAENAVAENPEPAATHGALVRQRPVQVVGHRVRRDLRGIRERVSDLAGNPAAVAAATVVTGIAVNIVREVAKSGALRREPGPLPVVVSGHVVHSVHVIHHVVHHHVVHHGYLPRPLPPLPPR